MVISQIQRLVLNGAPKFGPHLCGRGGLSFLVRGKGRYPTQISHRMLENSISHSVISMICIIEPPKHHSIRGTLETFSNILRVSAGVCPHFLRQAPSVFNSSNQSKEKVFKMHLHWIGKKMKGQEKSISDKFPHKYNNYIYAITSNVVKYVIQTINLKDWAWVQAWTGVLLKLPVLNCEWWLRQNKVTA